LVGNKWAVEPQTSYFNVLQGLQGEATSTYRFLEVNLPAEPKKLTEGEIFAQKFAEM